VLVGLVRPRSGRVDRERSDGGRLRGWITVLPHDLEMPGHCLSHDGHAIVVALRGGNTSGRVRAPGPVRTILGTLDNNDVSDQRSLRMMPVCFRMLRSVPGGNVSLGLPVEGRVIYGEEQRLITSPDPRTLKEFCDEIGKRLLERRPTSYTPSGQ